MRHLFLILSFLYLSSNVGSVELAPEFRLSELRSDTMHSLSDYRGTVVYLDFWASWCGPCRQSLPALDALQKEFNEEDFRVIAINLDEDSVEALAFLEQYPVSYTVLVERTGRTQRNYNLVGLPTSFLIDQNGEIIGSFQGFNPNHIQKLRTAIGYLLEP